MTPIFAPNKALPNIQDRGYEHFERKTSDSSAFLCVSPRKPRTATQLADDLASFDPESTPESCLGTNPLFLTQSMSTQAENLIIRAKHTGLEWLELPIPMEEIHTLAGLSHQEVVERIRALDTSDLQARTESIDNWWVLYKHICKGLAAMPGYVDVSFTTIFEGIMILRHWHKTCTSSSDYYVLARTAYMCFTGKALTSRIMEWLIPPTELQGFEEVVGAMRTAMDLGKSVTESELIKRLRKMYTFFPGPRRAPESRTRGH